MWPLKKVAGAAKSMAAQRRLLGMLQSSQSHSFASFLNSAIIFLATHFRTNPNCRFCDPTKKMDDFIMDG